MPRHDPLEVVHDDQVERAVPVDLGLSQGENVVDRPAALVVDRELELGKRLHPEGCLLEVVFLRHLRLSPQVIRHALEVRDHPAGDGRGVHLERDDQHALAFAKDFERGLKHDHRLAARGVGRDDPQLERPHAARHEVDRRQAGRKPGDRGVGRFQRLELLGEPVHRFLGVDGAGTALQGLRGAFQRPGKGSEQLGRFHGRRVVDQAPSFVDRLPAGVVPSERLAVAGEVERVRGVGEDLGDRAGAADAFEGSGPVHVLDQHHEIDLFPGGVAGGDLAEKLPVRGNVEMRGGHPFRLGPDDHRRILEHRGEDGLLRPEGEGEFGGFVGHTQRLGIGLPFASFGGGRMFSGTCARSRVSGSSAHRLSRK